MKGRLSFILALWLAIAVATLSALAPLGPPSSRASGSAFNPATTSVILKVRTPAPELGQPPVRPDGDGLAPSAPAAFFILPLALILAAVWAIRAVPFPIARQYSPEPLRFPSRRRARAPPILS